jgi:hypothetical protein
MISVLIIFQLILPYFGIWILEREIIFFFTIFVVSIPLILRRYYFSHLGYSIGKIFFFIASLSVAVSIVSSIENIANLLDKQDIVYWDDLQAHPFIEAVLIIIFYKLIQYSICQLIRTKDNLMVLEQEIQIAKRHIARISNIEEFNILLKKEMQRIFTASESAIVLYQSRDHEGFSGFFETYPKEKAFINDVVFRETHSYLFTQEYLNTHI